MIYDLSIDYITVIQVMPFKWWYCPFKRYIFPFSLTKNTAYFSLDHPQLSKFFIFNAKSHPLDLTRASTYFLLFGCTFIRYGIIVYTPCMTRLARLIGAFLNHLLALFLFWQRAPVTFIFIRNHLNALFCFDIIYLSLVFYAFLTLSFDAVPNCRSFSSVLWLPM